MEGRVLYGTGKIQVYLQVWYGNNVLGFGGDVMYVYVVRVLGDT